MAAMCIRHRDAESLVSSQVNFSIFISTYIMYR